MFDMIREFVMTRFHEPLIEAVRKKNDGTKLALKTSYTAVPLARTHY